MNQQLKTYIENNIFPMYDRYYSHGMLHINNVIKNCLMLAEYYNLDLNKAYTIAAYHDIGLSVNRENHEKESGKIFIKDKVIKKFFSDIEIKEMQEQLKIIEDQEKNLQEIYMEKFYQILIETLILKY